MIVAEMRSAHVPVEVLGLQVEGEDVRQDDVHRSGDVSGRPRLQVRRGVQWGNRACS